MNLPTRWEWRTFGEDSGHADARIREVTREQQPSEEIYLISPWSDLSVSIRDGALEVRSLEQRNASGLEKWRPVPQAVFPVEPAAVAAVFANWQVKYQITSKRRFSEVRLLSLVGDVAPDIAVIPVRKRRRVGSLSGCLVETSTAEVEGETIRTLAIEHEDASRVIAVLAELGLSAGDNTNYVKELRRVHGMGSTSFEQPRQDSDERALILGR